MANTSKNGAVRCALLVAFVSVFVSGCGSEKSPVGPTPPSQPPVTDTPAAPPPPPGNVRVASVDTAARTAVIQWNPSEGAEHYVVEYGPLLDGTVPRTTIKTDGPQTSFTLRDLPSDLFGIRVKAANGNGVGEASSPPATLQIVVMNDVIEALFFGTGPYGSGFSAAPQPPDYFALIARNEAHVYAGTMLGWRRGTIAVRVEQDVPSPLFANLVRALAQVVDLTDGEIRGEIVERTGTLPNVFELGELRVMVRETQSGLCVNKSGCAWQNVVAGGVIAAALVSVTPQATPDVMTHEIGHALLGLHHLLKIQWPSVR